MSHSARTEGFSGLVGRVFANGPGDRDSIPGRVIPKTLKMVLDASLLNTQHYKVRIKGKVEKSRGRSRAPLHLGVVAKTPFSIATTPRCRGGCYSFSCFFLSSLPLIRTLECWMLSNEILSTIFWLSGMTQPGIELRSPGPLVMFICLGCFSLVSLFN